MERLLVMSVVAVLAVAGVATLTGLPIGYAAALLVIVPLAATLSARSLLAERARRQRIERRKALIAKYGSETEADMIMNGQIWVGMTSEQLIDCLGRPEDMDHQVSARKQKEVWKYDRIGQNRYRNRITLEQDRVVGWTAR